MGLLSYTYWFALSLKVTPVQKANLSIEAQASFKRFRSFAWVVLGLLFLQLIYGALMAGHKAANAASTWPTINGEWVPTHLMGKENLILNAIDNTTWIHFVHRGLAYILLAVVIYWVAQMRKIQGNLFWSNVKTLPLYIVLLQVLLGIFSVLTSKYIIPGTWGNFEWMAQLHQLVGMLLLLSVLNIIYATKSVRDTAQ
jgi:cytochrome c oxidase assembly protein subunit 15